MFLEKIIAIIAPHDCLLCGYEGAVLCAMCLPDAVAPLPERCYGCHKLSRGCRVCPSCCRQSPLRNVWVRTQYDGFARRIVYKLKFDRMSVAAKPIAQMMADVLPYMDDAVIVTSVPTATSRVRQRGYDHAALLGKELAKLRGLPYGMCLSRLGQLRQVGASRSQRKKQLSGAFRVVADIRGKDVLLVDDVVTTGASLEEAARCLRMAGAKSVRAVVFAQK